MNQESQEVSLKDIMPGVAELERTLRKTSIILCGLIHLSKNDHELASKINKVTQCSNEIDINDNSRSLEECCTQLYLNLDRLDGVEVSIN